MQIFHNPRCTKSRQTLALLEEHGHQPEIILYLKEVPSAKEIKSVLQKLGISAYELLRKKEAIFKDNFKGKELTEDQWIAAMVEHPKLIERPIVIVGDKAAIGRPPEAVLEIL